MPETNVLNGRIRLKTDTEANWNAHPITPLSGEFIVYSADNDHPYSRIKVGDGATSTANLPFTNDVFTYPTREDFPSPGTINKLYVALSTGALYTFTPATGYVQLCKYNQSKVDVSQISLWRTGKITELSCEGGRLSVSTGILPTLSYSPVSVVYNISQEVPN